MVEEKMMMTREGMEKLEKEYRHLIDVDQPENTEALALARSQGDLSENADYDAARNRQAEIAARIAEIEHIKDIAVIAVEGAKAGKKIALSSVVTYKDPDGEMMAKVVGTVEADPLAKPYPLVSNESALGMALLGHVVGDKVTVECEEPYEIEIMKVEIGK